MSLLTVGHGPLEQPALTGLLRTAGVDLLVDVRSYPGSRRNPDVSRDQMAHWLPKEGIDYRWERHLGGRRHLTKQEDIESPDQWWQVAAFRAYAGHTRTEGFGLALGEVLGVTETARVVVMCSESVWWRCHRRLIADVVVLAFGVPVHHLMHDGAQRPHRVADGARVTDTDRVVWDGANLP